MAMRAVAKAVGHQWELPVVVENRPGDTTLPAAKAFNGVAPDGHVLLMLDPAHVCTNPLLIKDYPFNPEKDFEPVRPVFLTELYVVVPMDSPFQTIDDVIRAARAKPGEVVYGSWHMGSPGHLATLRLESQTGIRMRHRPFSSTVTLFDGVANREVDWAMGSLASSAAQVRKGGVRLITVAGESRSDLLPDVIAADESELARGYVANAWYGAFAPPGTPRSIKERISDDMREALQSGAVTEQYRRAGYIFFDRGPDEFADLIRKETASWKAVIEQNGLNIS